LVVRKLSEVDFGLFDIKLNLANFTLNLSHFLVVIFFILFFEKRLSHEIFEFSRELVSFILGLLDLLPQVVNLGPSGHGLPLGLF